MSWAPPVPRKHYLRTRFVAAMVALAIGVLAVTALATLGLARKADTESATKDLQGKAPKLATVLDQLLQARLSATGTATTLRNRNLVTNAVRRSLQLSGASVVTIRADGTVVDGFGATAAASNAPILQLPHGLQTSDLDQRALVAGQEQSGQRGQLVFVAHPLTPVPAGTPVLVLTQQVQRTVAKRAGIFFILAACIATAIAALIAFFLARRLTRPIGAMQDAARRIAGGDLTARVDLGGHPHDELADLARALNGMASELENARGLERGFILSVSHDLRTPLTSIRGYAEAIADGTVQGDDGLKRSAEIIASEARRLERLVADLLDLARLDAHQFSLTPRPIDAAEVVEAAALAFVPAADDLGITLDVDARERLPADADPERLGQIVANLVENALKYAVARIEVRVERTGSDVVLQVVDDGPGITTADLPHVFDRLYTSRTIPGRKVGTGLGLAIVRELSAAMNGAATVETGDTGGTRFVVRLPLPASVVPGTDGTPTSMRR